MSQTTIAAELPPIYDEIRLTGATRAKETSFWRELLTCFSLRNSLRSIGKLTPTVSRVGSTWQHSTSGADARKPDGVGVGVGVGGAPSGGMSDIKVIHGLRTLSMVWIIFGHTIGLVSPEMMGKFRLAARSSVEDKPRASLRAHSCVSLGKLLW